MSGVQSLTERRPELFDPNLPAAERIGRLEGVVMMMSELVRGQREDLAALGIRVRGLEETLAARTSAERQDAWADELADIERAQDALEPSA